MNELSNDPWRRRRSQSSIRCEVCGSASKTFVVFKVSDKVAEKLGTTLNIWKCSSDICDKKLLALMREE